MILIYGVARKSHLKSLQTVHLEGLRLVFGPFRTSPEESLYSEAYEPLLNLKFKKLGLQYYSKLKLLPSNPAYDSTFNPKLQNLFEQREKTIKTFGLCMKYTREDTDISLTNIHNTIQLSSSMATKAICGYPWFKQAP